MKIAAVKRNKKGFTLVELVIVIAVLAVLAAIAVPTVTNVISTANTNTDNSNAQTIELALKSAYAEDVAGTWTGTGVPAADALTVDQALKHEGLDGIAEMNKRVKQGTGFRFAFNNGHIECSTGDTALVGDGITGVTATTVKSALSIT